ncbi:MAG: ABC transporter ATP-binding protein [Candidatus Nanopelagicales bacterium]
MSPSTASAEALDEAIDKSSLRPPKTDGQTWSVLRRLVGYMIADKGKGSFLFGIGLRFVAVVALISLPWLTGHAVTVISTPGGTKEDLAQTIVAIFVVLVVYGICSGIAERIFARAATRGLYTLQRRLFDHLQKLSLSFFDRQPLGQLMSRVTNDTEAVSLFYEQSVAAIVRSLFQIVLIVVIMFFLDWRLTLAALLVVPVMLLVGGVLGRYALPAFAQLQSNLGELSGFQEETISGHKVIIASRRQDFAIKGHTDRAGDVFESGSRAFFSAILQFPVTQTLSMVMVVLVLITGGILSADGEIGVGEVIAFMGYAGLLAAPLSEIANMVTTTMNAAAGGRRIFELIDTAPEIVDAPDATPFEFRGGRVEFRDVDFSYVPGRRILHANSFVAEPGQKIGICGPTGAGKSTIINILTRYYDIDGGQILIDGQDIRTLSLETLRAEVGMVLQEAFLFSDTVYNNLLYARPDATREEVIAAAAQANADTFIDRLPDGYDTVLTERGANLSQGQRQMLTIARAILAEPKILILDEATSNVDTRTEKLIQQGLQRLMSGRTSFVIAHRLSTIRDADCILVVDAGRIVERGTHDELMAADGEYWELYMSQFKGRQVS